MERAYTLTASEIIAIYQKWNENYVKDLRSFSKSKITTDPEYAKKQAAYFIELLKSLYPAK